MKRGLHNIAKRIICLMLILAVALTLSGCDLTGWLYDLGYWMDDKVDDLGDLMNKSGYENLEEQDDPTDPEPAFQPPFSDAGADNDVSEVDEQVIVITEDTDGEETAAEGDTEESSLYLDEKLKADRYFAYHTLTPEEQKIYRLLYSSLIAFGQDAAMPTLDDKLIDRIFYCVLADNPELFYVKGYSLIRYVRGGNLERISVSGMYTMNKSEASVHQQNVDAYVNTCLAGAPSGSDDYEKIKYLYEYLIKNTEYDLNAENGQNCLSVFENGRSVCQGYSSAMQYLMNRAGLFCTVVRGVTTNNENHAWNLVRSDGDYYYVDVTWGDASYDRGEDEDLAKLPELPEVNYDFLCATSEDLSMTHRSTNVFPLPECVSRADYYYVREGNYFEDVNEDQLRYVFSKAYENGQNMVTVKCADAVVYERMKYYLTGEGRIFDYLNQKGNVNYWCLEKYNKMVFCI